MGKELAACYAHSLSAFGGQFAQLRFAVHQFVLPNQRFGRFLICEALFCKAGMLYMVCKQMKNYCSAGCWRPVWSMV